MLSPFACCHFLLLNVSAEDPGLLISIKMVDEAFSFFMILQAKYI